MHWEEVAPPAPTTVLFFSIFVQSILKNCTILKTRLHSGRVLYTAESIVVLDTAHQLLHNN
jgi:hypothetical protein